MELSRRGSGVGPASGGGRIVRRVRYSSGRGHQCGCRRTGRARAAGQLAPPEVGPCVSAAGRKINCGRMPGARKRERQLVWDSVPDGQRKNEREMGMETAK